MKNLAQLKRITIVTALFFSLISCNKPDLSGTISGAPKPDATVYLINPKNMRGVAAAYFGQVIDSAVLDENGNFRFDHLPQTQEPVLLELAVKVPGMANNYLETDHPDAANYMPLVWQSGEKIKIDAQYGAFQKTFEMLSPSDVNKALLDLRTVYQNAYLKHIAQVATHVNEHNLMEKEAALLRFQQELMAFAEQTPELLAAMVATRWASPEYNYERIPEFLVNQCAKWQKVQPEHPWVSELCAAAQPAQLPLLLGDVFPNVKLPLLDADTVYLNEILGSKLTLVDVWASWCAPCRKENREVLVPLWDAFHQKGLQIVAYGLEGDADSWRAAVIKDGANRWMQASDLLGDAPPFMKKLRIQTIPANYVLNEKGVVIAKNLHGKALTDFIAQHLAE